MRTVQFFIILTMLLMGQVSPGFAQTKEEFSKMYVDYLTQEGYSAEERDGFVIFKFEGRSYILEVNEEDPEFFRIIFPNFWEIENEEERVKVREAADYSNAKSKVSKIFSVDDNTWGSIEILLVQPQDFRKVFPRALQALQNGVRNFLEKMQNKGE